MKPEEEGEALPTGELRSLGKPDSPIGVSAVYREDVGGAHVPTGRDVDRPFRTKAMRLARNTGRRVM
jgi:hypothetical protein